MRWHPLFGQVAERRCIVYHKGEYAVYGSNGVCQVGEVTTLNLDQIPKDRKYYVLYPRNNGGKVYVPVDKADLKMRRILTREEAEELIEKIPTIVPITVTNEKLLEEMYKKCMRCYDCTEWIRLIKCIYSRKQTRLSEGKKITATDERYMHMAEESLYWELGTALDIPRELVLEYIIKQIEKDKEE